MDFSLLQIVVSAGALLMLVTWQPPQDAGAQSWRRMAPIAPKGYVSYYTPEAPRIDGRLDDPAWADAPWTDPFEDIEGDLQPKPPFETRAAIRWDDDYLYVAARLEDPNVWGSITTKNTPIFQDNDFEIFIDPDGDNHNYYEFEVNPLNTIWELSLEKPYRDGGPVHSPANIQGLISAVHVEGTLNAAHDEDRGWSVEVAIPWTGLAPYSPRPVPPRDGEQWRINFSRVHWQFSVEGNSYVKVPDTPENNWVWSPQGVVDMHRPERWGYVQFSRAKSGEAPFRNDPTLALRDALMAVYHAQRDFRRAGNVWARSLDELPGPFHPDVILTSSGDGWTARINAGEHTIEVDHESRIKVQGPRS